MVDDLVKNWTNPPEILIVDDDPFVLKAIQDAFTVLGCNTREALSGLSALSIYREMLSQGFHEQGASAHPFDMIYLDLRLPDISGEDVLREIRTLWPPQPITLITGNSGVTWTRYGVVGVTEKPLNLDTLRMSLVMHNIRTPGYRRTIPSSFQARQG